MKTFRQPGPCPQGDDSLVWEQTRKKKHDAVGAQRKSLLLCLSGRPAGDKPGRGGGRGSGWAGAPVAGEGGIEVCSGVLVVKHGLRGVGPEGQCCYVSRKVPAIRENCTFASGYANKAKAGLKYKESKVKR